MPKELEVEKIISQRIKERKKIGQFDELHELLNEILDTIDDAFTARDYTHLQKLLSDAQKVTVELIKITKEGG